MKITQKGQVTIPQEIREKAGMLPDTEVEFIMDGTVVIVRKKKMGGRGKKIVEKLRGKSTTRLSTEQIMALTRGET